VLCCIDGNDTKRRASITRLTSRSQGRVSQVCVMEGGKGSQHKRTSHAVCCVCTVLPQVVEALQQAGVRCRINVVLDGPVAVDVALVQPKVGTADAPSTWVTCVLGSIGPVFCSRFGTGAPPGMYRKPDSFPDKQTQSASALTLRSEAVLLGYWCALSQVGARYRVALQLHPHEDFAANPPRGALGPTAARWRALQARGWRVSGVISK
jgi:hypothetical protein